MGNVAISPNLKKKAVRIDLQGNTFDPKTKEVVPAEPEYIPPVQPAEAPKGGIQSKIEAKIEEIINRKIEEALNKLL